jgi:hypothetical protein
VQRTHQIGNTMKVRLEPVNICIDVEGDSVRECIAKACAALALAGFKETEDGAYWILRDSRAIDGTDSGSPVSVGWNGETT